MGEKYVYLIECFRLIIKNKDKIQEALCYLILPRYDDFSKDYKIFKNYKKYKDIEECLASIFGISAQKMKDMINKLNDYKNEKDRICECMNVNIH